MTATAHRRVMVSTLGVLVAVALLVPMVRSRLPAWRDVTMLARPLVTRGEPAPEFELSALDGRSVKLSDFRGRPVLLNFWATWCGPCRIETPWLVELYVVYHPQGVDFIGISMDDPGQQVAVRDFARSMSVNYPLLFGSATVADAFGGVRLLPQTFFIGRDGRLVDSTVGVTSKADLDAIIRRLLTATYARRARPLPSAPFVVNDPMAQ